MVNWALLVAQGRAKAVGIPWSNEELKARFELGIPADAIRRGILTKEDYLEDTQKEAEMKDSGKEMPLDRLKKDELLALAEERGIEVVDPKVTTKADLISLIETKVEE